MLQSHCIVHGFGSQLNFHAYGSCRPPGSEFNIAAARVVDREFNYNFGSNLGLFGSGREFTGRGAPVGFIWTDFQLNGATPTHFTPKTVVCDRFQLGSSRELGNLASDLQDCFRTTQRVLGLTPIWFLLRTEPWRPVS